MRILIQY